MSFVRDSSPVRILLVLGIAFLAAGWVLRALAVNFLPGIDVDSFGVGAAAIGLAAGGVAFALGRLWRPKALERARQIHRGVLAHAFHSVISTDLHGRIETFSGGAERLLGHRADDVVGHLNLAIFHDPEQLKSRAQELATALKRPVVAGFETLIASVQAGATTEERDWSYLRLDGTRVPVRVSITAMRSRSGRITGYLAIANDLSEQRSAEERRREFDTRLSKIATQIPGMVFQFKREADGRQCFPFASEGIRDIYRVAPEEVRHDSAVLWDLIHPEDVDRVKESIDQSAARLQRWDCEYRTRFPDGSIHWLHGNALPERQPDGAILWHGFITDVTERKRAEQAHEESRALLQSVFSSVDLGVFVVDVTTGGDFRFVEVNPAYERLTGIKAEEIRGRGPRELVPLISAEMAECLRASFRRGTEADGPIEYEEPFFVRGRLLWWLTRLAPLRDSVGNVVRLVGRSLDITERKTIELRFRSLTERLQLATEAAQVGIWDHDLLEKRIVWDNRMHALYGMQPNEFEGTYRAWRALVHPEDIARIEQESRAAQEGRRPFNTSYRIIRPDGDVREVRVCAHVQRNPAGRAIRMVGVNWDVTAERQAQAEIVRARDEAEHLNRQLEEALARANQLAQEAGAATVAKSEFLANMSHEIRTPLNAVLGMSGLLLSTNLSQEQRELAETIRSSGDGLLGLLNDILDYSKIESGRLDLEQRPFDLRDCVESALDVLGGRAAEKGIDLLCSLEPDVPETIAGDDTRLRQVLVNLLSNAVKFTSKGEVVLSVAVASRAEGSLRLRFAVRDSGIGIPAERMDRLFKTFSQVDASTTRQYGGTGLGLAICKRLVDLMGGRIWVESVVGQGSVFIFEIVVESSPASDKPFIAPAAAFPRRRVLIVDDNQTSGRVLAQLCTRWGLTPQAVTSAAEALRLLREEGPYDLALIDAEMPETSGTELVETIRKDRALGALPIAMLTRPGSERVSGQLAVAGFLTKPVKAGALFEVLGDLLQGRPVPQPVQSVGDTAGTQENVLRILLAEDNPVNQRVAILMLQRLGYRADLAANGREALDAVIRQSYDLVLMDVQMPEMDGLQATREITARFPAGTRPRIVAMTANASTSDREQCFAAGMDDFLTKPVRMADLQRALQAAAVRGAITSG
jgi:PAS domain S-box-containing protein